VKKAGGKKKKQGKRKSRGKKQGKKQEKAGGRFRCFLRTHFVSPRALSGICSLISSINYIFIIAHLFFATGEAWGKAWGRFRCFLLSLKY
jgi:hypothetical protein